ncbi:MAG: flavin reductase family protein [bacterium]
MNLKKVKFENYINFAVKSLSGGAFLTVKNNNEVNTMTIGWGSFGLIWGKPILMVMVRKSRYTYNLINDTDNFTVSIPEENSLKDELKYCGTKSGRDVNKFKECNLSLIASENVNSPLIEDAFLHFECEILYKQNMDGKLLIKDFDEKWYPNNNYHTLYYGEILGCYLNNIIKE